MVWIYYLQELTIWRVIMTKRVGIYARTSLGSDRQDITRQVSELKQIVKNHNWELIDTYVDEGYSRTTTSRPELNRMMRDANIRKFEMVITLELSRLGASLKNMIEIVDKLREKKIQLFIVNQQIDTSTATGYMFFSIMTSISNYEKELISERVKSGLENAKRKGIKLGRKTNLDFNIKQKIIDMKSQNIGMKKISKDCKVGRKTILEVWDSHTSQQM